MFQRARTDISIRRLGARREADHHHPGHRRARLQHLGRLGGAGKGYGGLRKALLDDLAGTQQIGSRLEDELDRGQARHRLRTQDVDPRNIAQEIGLQGNGDKLRDFLRREAQRLALHVDDYRAELGIDIDRHIADAGRSRRRGALRRRPQKAGEIFGSNRLFRVSSGYCSWSERADGSVG